MNQKPIQSGWCDGCNPDNCSGCATPAAPAQVGEYPPLVCDYCGALTPDPWHSSGMLHGKMSKHTHSCDSCAAQQGESIEQEAMQMLWNDQPQEEKEHYLNVARGAERIKQGLPTVFFMPPSKVQNCSLQLFIH